MLDGCECQVVVYDVGAVMCRKTQKQRGRLSSMRCNNKRLGQGDSIGQIAVACFRPQTFVEGASLGLRVRAAAKMLSDIAVTYLP